MIGKRDTGLKESLDVELHRKWMIVDSVVMLQIREMSCC